VLISGVLAKAKAELLNIVTYAGVGWDYGDETDNGARDIWWIDEGQDYPRLLWELDNAADPGVVVRLAHLAVEHAQAVETLRDRAVSTLVQAHCRAGHWNVAVPVFHERGDASRAYVHDHFFVTMAHWHVKNREEARAWYDGGSKNALLLVKTSWTFMYENSSLLARAEKGHVNH